MYSNKFSTTVMAAVSVTICFRELLRDVCQRFSLAPAIYGISEEDEKGLVSIRVDVQFFGEDTELQSMSCWGGPCVSIDRAEEDVARRAVGKLRDELLFEVRDFNLEDKKNFENLYTRLWDISSA